ncbi:glycosyl hydrolase [Streptomyces shenzhenensis]|uniref:glycosyl hydrolase n=1 Tax=Streptomyces shenzhenensis TaxID=943815 RepID=UPI0015F095D0|nr:glycosyl hydrolase [Streptomyces shenzhenensis]
MAPQHGWTRTGRLAVTAVTVAAAMALTSGPGFAAVTVRPAHSPVPTPVTTPSPSPVTTPSPLPVTTPSPSAVKVPAATPVPSVSKPPQQVPSAPATGTPAPTPRQETPAYGAFLGSDALGVARIASFSNWLGGTEVRVGHTYLPGDRWSNIEGQPDFLQVWADWRRAKDNRMFVLNVPMQERNEENLSDAAVRVLLRQGAAGEFDQHFRVLAQRLVAAKVPDTVLVPGWEMNGTTYTHRCAPDPEAWKKYWKRIVTVMRSVPGQRFRFDFAPSRGLDAVAWTRCYPGDDTVDIIGMDAYDQPRGLSFDEQVTEPYGLQAQVDFAKSHGKPISYPEWGLFRNGDNPVYMRRMLEWMDQHKPVYNTLTDYCPHGVWECNRYSLSSLVYRSALFSSASRPTGPATPTTSVPRPPATGCSPLDTGDWLQHWPGVLMCLRPESWLRAR